ncbi:MAG: glycosyltransferase [Aliarcobacter skirrowii]|uniref:glycosyltransferase n=1 Tax=Aliarcobacter skirrowii TaxID=28200 RepID=UPI002432285B|nr:glycosyltransferase [Aliarcobacter skirrowii]MDD2509186.1 glycosyltransferase [Aliarcobacter skirrowii]MDD3497460.1 glycosyltransferase [Aliarcobacter skirrowii]
MSNIPKISILVPIYNVEKYLDECLTSIISQTLKNIEIICINDGSTDNSLEIIQKYMQNDPRIKLINKRNSGYGDSMNQGLKVAKGEYIGIIESDDIAKKKMFKTLYNLAKKNNFPDIIKSNYFEYFSTTNESRLKKNISRELCNKYFKPQKEPKIFKSAPSIWSAIYKNDFLKKFNINFLSTPGASYQDTSFNFKTLYFASSIYCTSKAFLQYRQDNINSSVNNKEKIFYICDEFDEIEKTIEKDLKIKPLVLTLKLNSYWWNYQRLAEKHKDIFLNKFQEELIKDKLYINKNLFTKKRYILLIKLLNSIDSFKKELQNRKIKHLNSKTKKLIFKMNLYENQSFILYGFNDIAKNIVEKNLFKISLIIDRNSLEKEFNNISICSINNLNKKYYNSIFVITAINPIFIKEIKKTMLNISSNIQIISL